MSHINQAGRAKYLLTRPVNLLVWQHPNPGCWTSTVDHRGHRFVITHRRDGRYELTDRKQIKPARAPMIARRDDTLETLDAAMLLAQVWENERHMEGQR